MTTQNRLPNTLPPHTFSLAGSFYRSSPPPTLSIVFHRSRAPSRSVCARPAPRFPFFPKSLSSPFTATLTAIGTQDGAPVSSLPNRPRCCLRRDFANRPLHFPASRLARGPAGAHAPRGDGPSRKHQQRQQRQQRSQRQQAGQLLRQERLHTLCAANPAGLVLAGCLCADMLETYRKCNTQMIGSDRILQEAQKQSQTPRGPHLLLVVQHGAKTPTSWESSPPPPFSLSCSFFSFPFDSPRGRFGILCSLVFIAGDRTNSEGQQAAASFSRC